MKKGRATRGGKYRKFFIFFIAWHAKDEEDFLLVGCTIYDLYNTNNSTDCNLYVYRGPFRNGETCDPRTRFSADCVHFKSRRVHKAEGQKDLLPVEM